MNKAMHNGKCRVHGGTSVKGRDSGTYKTGRYSKYMPQRMMETYAEALSDTELLSLREAIAAADARITDVMTRVDTGESGRIWFSIQKEFSRFEDAQSKRDIKAASESLMELRRLVSQGHGDWAAWQEIMNLWEVRRRLSETEARRLERMQYMVTVEEAMNMIRAITESVRSHVKDKSLLRAISEDYARILGSVQSPAMAAKANGNGR